MHCEKYQCKLERTGIYISRCFLMFLLPQKNLNLNLTFRTIESVSLFWFSFVFWSVVVSLLTIVQVGVLFLFLLLFFLFPPKANVQVVVLFFLFDRLGMPISVVQWVLFHLRANISYERPNCKDHNTTNHPRGHIQNMPHRARPIRFVFFFFFYFYLDLFFCTCAIAPRQKLVE